jgi:hypothetical protein
MLYAAMRLALAERYQPLADSCGTDDRLEKKGWFVVVQQGHGRPMEGITGCAELRSAPLHPLRSWLLYPSNE